MRARNCGVCGYQPVNIAGFWAFMPTFCCEGQRPRKMHHTKRAGRMRR